MPTYESQPPCPYEHTFPVYLGSDKKCQCLKEKDHKGNHVVIDPKTKKLMEVAR